MKNIEPTYYNVLKILSNKERKRIAKILKKIKNYRDFSGGRIVSNIKNDLRISNTTLKDIFDNMNSIDSLNKKNIIDSFLKSCRLHKLDGPLIQQDKIQLIGRAETFDIFYYKLKAVLIDEKEVDKIIYKLSNKIPLNIIEKKIILSPTRICWYTWSNDSSNIDPLFFTQTANDKILAACANLGLQHSQIFEPNVFIRINKPITSKLKYPTIADAELYEYFKPPDDLDEHGFTEIWHPDEIKDKSISLKRRPEAVDTYYELGYYESIEIHI